MAEVDLYFFLFGGAGGAGGLLKLEQYVLTSSSC